ncbi:hypothetical protein TrCOL_g5039 [Triparma columacea]|uniref:V-type proton ATPase proteolipid subunit n=1 Tax=Triparma columacea TaxID=722753 RepID=A0A9W7L992_9STRA|nr:hypothetical protein TrCOL_g5039 [Triparma columacea]
MSEYPLCTPTAPFFGFMGVAFSLIFANLGAAYGTAKSGVGVLSAGVQGPDLIYKNLIPIIMAGVNGIYGLITAIIILNNIIPPNLDGNTPLSYSLYTGYAHLAGGLCCGLCGLASGVCIGIAGESGVRAFTQLDWMTKQRTMYRVPGARRVKKGGADQIFVGSVLIQVFAGNLALYGMITAIILTQTSYNCE